MHAHNANLCTSFGGKKGETSTKKSSTVLAAHAASDAAQNLHNPTLLCGGPIDILYKCSSSRPLTGFLNPENQDSMIDPIQEKSKKSNKTAINVPLSVKLLIQF